MTLEAYSSQGANKLESVHNQSAERHDSTSLSTSDEPNFLIYNLIKELDYLVESNNIAAAYQ